MNFQLNKPQMARQYLYGALAVILVAAVCYALSSVIGYRFVAFILLLVVSIVAVLFDILPVLLTASLSAFIWDFFFIPPRFNLHVDTTEDSILLIMYFVIALINGALTYKIRQAEKLTRLKEERANSVQLYNTILDSLSHELRTPVAAIIGATDNLQLNANLSPQNREQLLTEISKAAMRLNQQIENLLNLSRLESGHVAPKKDWVDIGELVHEVVGRVEDNRRNRNIGISVPGNLPLFFTDKGMLDQVLYNLVNNAAVHTPEHTRIDVVISWHADLLEFIIEDNGKGFTNEEMKHVFDKFSRSVRNRKEGSGLGLSIVKGFTEALGGSIELQRSGSNGARFIVVIPVKTLHKEMI
jgi:two-component system, OmpR family, sensor histidine kinase KdpD